MLAPLQTALLLGLQYPPLAATALRALEGLEGRSQSTLAELAPAIVPCLEPYLAPINVSDLSAPAASAEGNEAAAAVAEGKGEADEGEAAAKEVFNKIRAEAETSAKRARLLRFQVVTTIADLSLHVGEIRKPWKCSPSAFDALPVALTFDGDG